MAISYVGGQVGNRSGNSNTPLSVNFAFTGGSNSTPSAGDIVIVTPVVGSQGRNPAQAIVTPSGYAALGQLNPTAVTYDTSLNTSWKVMGSTPDTSVTIPAQGNTADAQAYVIQCWRGVDPNNPMDVTAISATGTATGRPDPGAITPGTPGAAIVIHGGGAAAAGATYTAPTNYTTNFRTDTGADTNDAMVGGGYRLDWSSGQEDPAAFGGGTTGANDSWAAYTIALRPLRSGSMAATESGADTASMAGDVIVQGSLAVSEAATKDSFSSTGKVIVQGSLAATETGADVFAADGDVFIEGDLAATETGADTFEATGTVESGTVTGDLAATETGSDTFAATGAVLVEGDLAATESGADAFAATGDVIIQGSLTATESGADTFAATGDVFVQGDLAATETGADAFASDGEVLVQGDLAATESGADAFAATGTVSWGSPIFGTLDATESGSDTASMDGQIIVQGLLAAIETGADAFNATGQIIISGALAAVESGEDVFAATGTVHEGGVTYGIMAAQEIGQDGFWCILPAACRTELVVAEHRSAGIAAETRVLPVTDENRTARLICGG